RLDKGGAKGGTVYVDGSRDSQVLTLKAEENNNYEKTELFDDVKQPTVVLMDTIQELEHTDVTIGYEIGNTCPVDSKGSVKHNDGCNTYTRCDARLKCGL